MPASSSYSSSESGSKKVEEDKAAPANKTTESKKLYVGNLSPEIKESILWTTFEKYGTILELHLILNKTTGKVRYILKYRVRDLDLWNFWSMNQQSKPSRN